MIKSLMLAGMLAAAAEGPAIADGSMVPALAEPSHSVAATDAQRCFDPKTWLPGTLQIEKGDSARHADCALV